MPLLPRGLLGAALPVTGLQEGRPALSGVASGEPTKEQSVIMKLRPRLLAGIAGIALVGSSAFFACPSRADDETAAIGDLVVEDVSATPVQAGETTRITFSIENTGSENVTVTGLRLAVPGPSKVVGFLGTSHSGRIDGFPVGPGESTRLDGRTAWIEVGPRASDLVPGSVVTGRLVLGAFEAPLTIHVGFMSSATPVRHSTVSVDRWLSAIKC
jgi:hypothetical protein